MARLATHIRRRLLAGVAGLLLAMLVAPGAALAQTTDTTAPAAETVADHAKKIKLPGELPGVTSAPWDLTVTANAVWVLEPRAGMVYRLDPKSNRVAARVKLPAPGCVPHTCPGMDRIVAAGSDVWVINNQAASLVHIDARTNKVRESIPITAPTYLQPLAVPGGLWYSPDQAAGDIAFMDSASDKITKTAHVGVDTAAPLAVVGDTLWASSSLHTGPTTPPDDALYKIDAQTAEVVATLPGLSGVGVVLGSDFWLNRLCCPLVTRVDGTTGAAVADVHVDGGSDFLAAGEGSVWVRAYGQTLREHWILRVNPDDGTSERFDLPTTQLTGGIGVGHHSVWIADWNDNAVYRMPVPVR
jgi:hypothetical protein